MANDYNEEAHWYVAHTYSGYENKVKASIEATVENRHMEDIVLEVSVPTQEVTEMKDGKRITKEKKLFPGYVIVHMIMTDESWYVVRNTRGVTGFVGPASKPVPLSQAELKSMGIKRQSIEVDFAVGDEVVVTHGPFESFSGLIEEINMEKSKVKVNLSMFGRETPTELDFEDIKKISNT